LTGDPRDNDWLIEAAAAARFVLLGEASHGTHEFYRERASITRRLIEEKGFSAVAIEGDWPDADRVNRFVRGRSRDAEAVEALDTVLHLDKDARRRAAGDQFRMVAGRGPRDLSVRSVTIQEIPRGEWIPFLDELAAATRAGS